MDPGNTARILTALRVLAAFYKLGQTATMEDIANVRRWAGDESLSPMDAAASVVRRELENGRRDPSGTGVNAPGTHASDSDALDREELEKWFRSR